MAKDTPEYPIFDHDAYARTRSSDDFWGQIRRTVNGHPVSNEQIQLIVNIIRQRLELDTRDHLLDIGCGNGALTRYFYDCCAQTLGVDFSEYLINIANQNFSIEPTNLYLLNNVVDYLSQESNPGRFTKVLCYGCFSYFSYDDALNTLGLLNHKFNNVKIIFIGNLPDKGRLDNFYTSRKPAPGEIDDPRSQIGIWRSGDEFKELAYKTGWDIQITLMPESFYSAHYRYDVTLRRSGSALLRD